MRLRPGRFVVAFAVCGLVGLSIAVSSLSPFDLGRTELIGSGSNKPETSPGQENKTFALSGDVTGLFPGSTKTLEVEIRNPQSFAIRVTEIRVAVGDVPRGGGTGPCEGLLVGVTGLAGPVVVPRNATAATQLEVTLSGSAPDGCKNVNFPLTYSGRADKA